MRRKFSHRTSTLFDSLSERLGRTLRGISGKTRLSERNLADAMREVRRALLEADVALPVVKSFIDKVRSQALGQVVGAALNPGERFVKIVHEQLVETMGRANDALNLAAVPPAVILMAGLQGAGKTTTAAKLALFLKERHGKKVALVSADVHRPAAIAQLQSLAGEVGAEFLPSSADEAPAAIAKRALKEAERRFADALIVDAAGRLAIDEPMMREMRTLQDCLRPIETLFVVDAMTGQDAALAAKAFDEALNLTGVVLAKADGDARGGAALSVRFVTGKPIKFLGMGERPEALQPFHPERLASRILGMGDLLSLIEEAERNVDKGKAERLARKLSKGQRFDLEDFREQLRQMASMGGAGSLLEKLPGAGQLPAAAQSRLDDGRFRQFGVIIDSMTLRERRFPDLIDGSRKKRIALGSGTQIADVNRLLKQHRQMQKTMKKTARKGGMQRMMRGLQGMSSGAQGAAPGLPVSPPRARAGRRRK